MSVEFGLRKNEGPFFFLLDFFQRSKRVGKAFPNQRDQIEAFNEFAG